jgi:hypothetical protein
VNDANGGQQERPGDEAAPESLPQRKPENGAALGAHEINQANGSDDGSDSNERPPRYFFPRITINEFLTAVLSVASLVVSYLTYHVVADTSDIKAAIRNLSDLATQAQRQADATNGQLAEMRDEQRPWLQVTPEIRGPLVVEGGQLSMKVGLLVRNSGRTPAISVRGRAQLKVASFLKIEDGVDAVRLFCKTPVPTPSWKRFFDGGVGDDAVFPNGEDVIEIPAVADEETAFPFGFKEFGVKQIGPYLNIIFCIAYKTIGGDDILHTGEIIPLSYTKAVTAKDAQTLPPGPLQLDYSSFERHTFAD